MIAPDLETGIARLRAFVEAAERIVPFTGAGISTECGIPDFRSPGGYWTRNQPIPFQEFLTSQEARDETWRRRFRMREEFGDVRPGRGHGTLAAWYRSGKVPGIITQNIDNLHQASGVDAAHVVELHGNTSYACCLSCSKRYEIPWVEERFESEGYAPDCPACGGFIKTATIAFGQSMPEDAMQKAEDLARASDLFIVLGSSLVVWPAAGFPLIALRSGASLVIVNREPTEFDDLAALVIRQDIGSVLGPLTEV
ncbi:MAG TPA: Sir2 family NAD-dependent protein deacetylase [Xanthobacteraceae bacterium]|nr:Sir2 family NAD-dependent protein deacetylase [Xanthobacteraceae bacterium]